MKKILSLKLVTSTAVLFLIISSCNFLGNQSNQTGVTLVPLKSPDEELEIVTQNRKSGFVNNEGQWVIAPKYDFVYGFNDGVALVTLDGKELLIDKTDKKLLIPKEAVTIANFICGLTPFTNAENKTGYFNRAGKIVVPAEYDALMLPWDGMRILVKNELYTYVDSLGNIIGEPGFVEGNDFSEGLAQVKQNGKYGFINKKGEWVLEPIYDYASKFQEGIATIGIGDSLNMKSKFIDKNGTTIYEIPDNYYIRSAFDHGICSFSIKKDDGYKFGIMDNKGTVIIEPKYDWIELQNDDDLPDSRNGLGYLKTRLDGLHGIIFKNILIEPAFASITNFHEGLAAASIKENGKEKFGFIDTSGKWIIQPTFQGARNFHNGLAAISTKRDTWGYIDKTGKVVIQPQFDFAGNFGVNIAIVQIGLTDLRIDRTGKELKN